MRIDLRGAAAQLREDAVDCWGIRRTMNLRAAARQLDAAADRIEELERKLALQKEPATL